MNVRSSLWLHLAVAILATCKVDSQQNGEVMVPFSSASQPRLSARASEPIDVSPTSTDKVKVQYVDVNGLPVLVQFTYTGPPKILPIASADSYPEGSTINLICTVSGGQRKGLTLGWSKDGQPLNDEYLRFSSSQDNISIEKTGIDISILRITNATYRNSGQFSCSAKNPLGEDSTSVNIVINGMYPFTHDQRITLEN